MFIQANPSCLINMDHVIKIEAGVSATEGNFIVIYHTLNAELKWTKIFFEKNEVARNEYMEKIIKSYENGEKICK